MFKAQISPVGSETRGIGCMAVSGRCESKTKFPAPLHRPSLGTTFLEDWTEAKSPQSITSSPGPWWDRNRGLGCWLLTSVWIPGTPCSAKAWGHWERRNVFYRLLQGAVDGLALEAHSSNVICLQEKESMLLLPNNWLSNQLLPGVVVHTQQWVPKGSRFLWVQSQPALHSKIQDSQGYIETLSTTTRSQFFHPEIIWPSSILSEIPDRWIVFYLTSISMPSITHAERRLPGKEIHNSKYIW